MASSLFLIIMPFKFLHHVAWPLLALLYPMCASVQAIETDSYEETKHLISYWILLSLIYLFDYAFMSFLPWFQLWMYIKLMFIFWLTIPDFGRASYVYNNLIRSMKLKIDTWRKCFVEKENFLILAERYMKENGTETLEKLIASKNTMCRPDAEVTNEIIVTDNKEMLKTNGETLQIEHKDIKNLEAIEKKEIPVTKQDISVMPIIGPSPNAASATVETKGAADSDRAGVEVPHSCASTEKEVQKEWSCALCLVTALSEEVWNAHLNGRKHRASQQKQKDAEVTNEIIASGNKEMLKTNGERLETEHKDIKDLEAVEKKEIHETKQDIIVMPKIEPSQNASSDSASVETKGTVESDRAGGEVRQSSTSTQKEVQKQWTCALCLLTITCEKSMTMHLNGKRHWAALQKQKNAEVKNQPIATDNKEILKTIGERLQIEHKNIKNLEAIEKHEILVTKQDISVMPIIGASPNASSSIVETKGTTDSDIDSGEVPQSSTSTEKEVQKEWTCALCLVTAQNEKVWNSHLSGRKHRASLQKQKDAEVTNEIIATDNKEMLKTNEERFQTEHKDIKGFEAVEKKEIHETKQDIPVMPNIEPSQKASSATVQTKGTIESDRAGGEVPQNSTSTQKEVQKEWTCDLCLLTFTCEKTMNIHLNGRRHGVALQKQKDSEVTNQLKATDDKEILRTNGERLQTEHKDIKDSEAIVEKEIPSTKQDILVMPKIGPSQTASSATVETKGKAKSDTVGGEVSWSSTSTESTLKEVQKEWTCALCLVTTTSEKNLNCHFNGRKHQDALEASLKAKKQPAPQKLQIYQPKVEVKQKNFSDMLNSNVKNGDGIVNKGLKGTVVMDHKVQKPQNFNFHIIRPTPSTQAVRGPTPFGQPMSSPTGFPFPYHSGTTPFRGPTPSPINVPFPYYGPEGSWSRQPEFTYFSPTPRLPYQDPNRR